MRVSSKLSFTQFSSPIKVLRRFGWFLVESFSTIGCAIIGRISTGCAGARCAGARCAGARRIGVGCEGISWIFVGRTKTLAIPQTCIQVNMRIVRECDALSLEQFALNARPAEGEALAQAAVLEDDPMAGDAAPISLGARVVAQCEPDIAPRLRPPHQLCNKPVRRYFSRRNLANHLVSFLRKVSHVASINGIVRCAFRHTSLCGLKKLAKTSPQVRPVQRVIDLTWCSRPIQSRHDPRTGHIDVSRILEALLPAQPSAEFTAAIHRYRRHLFRKRSYGTDARMDWR